MKLIRLSSGEEVVGTVKENEDSIVFNIGYGMGEL